MNSSRVRGRSAASRRCRPPTVSPSTSREPSSWTTSGGRRTRVAAHARSSERRAARSTVATSGVRRASGATALTASSASRVDQPSPTSAAWTWPSHAGPDLAGVREVDDRAGGRPEAVLELEHDALGALAADPGHPHERLEVLGGHGDAQLVGGVDREHGLREPWADPGGGLEELEDGTLVVVGEAVEREGVLAHDQGGRQRGRVPDPQAGEGAGGALQAEPDAADLEDRRCRSRGRPPARDVGDHEARRGDVVGSGGGGAAQRLPRRPGRLARGWPSACLGDLGGWRRRSSGTSPETRRPGAGRAAAEAALRGIRERGAAAAAAARRAEGAAPDVADGQREGVGGVGGLGRLGQPEQAGDHRADLAPCRRGRCR